VQEIHSADTLSAMNTTHVITIAEHGGPERMQLTEVSLGAPAAGEVQIRHHAIGVNYIDCYQRAGVYPMPMPLQLGMEGAGIIEAVGEGVTHLKAGDRAAYASQPPGSYSTARCLPAKAVCKLPDEISFETGAAMMLKGLTVQYLLRKTAQLERGDAVLFHAAAGGVGLIAGQWARAMGLKIIGTAGSPEKCALALEHGYDVCLNYREPDLAARVKAANGGRGVKVVFDSVGKDTFDASLDSLAPFGLMVSYGNASGNVAPLSVGTLAAKGSLYLTRPTLFTHIATRESTQAMADDLFGIVKSGAVKIPVNHRFALKDVADAHRALESRATTGCIVLTP
jgi:NADPH:quinone reductase